MNESYVGVNLNCNHSFFSRLVGTVGIHFQAQNYFKTIIKGVSSYYPDYIMIVIDTKKGLRETDA